MALTPFDMEGVNRDLLAAGNPAKPDMQSILRRNARDLVLGNAILVSSVDAKELEFGVHMAYSDADGGFDTDPSEDVWFEASSLPIPNERPDLPPDNALRIRVTDVLTEYGFTDIDVKAPDRTPEGIWIGFEAMQPVRLDVTSAQGGRSVSFTLTAAEANDWRSGRLDAHGLSRMAVERVLARPGDTVTLAYGDSLFRPAVMCDGSGRLPEHRVKAGIGTFVIGRESEAVMPEILRIDRTVDPRDPLVIEKAFGKENDMENGNVPEYWKGLMDEADLPLAGIVREHGGGLMDFHRMKGIERLTGLRKLLHAPAWTDAVLLMQWEVARRRAGVGASTMMTAQWSPWFTFHLGSRVPRTAFRPQPNVDGGILVIRRVGDPKIPIEQRKAFQAMVHTVFTARGRGIGEILRRAGLFSSRSETQSWLRSRGIDPATLPPRLHTNDWIDLFQVTGSSLPHHRPISPSGSSQRPPQRKNRSRRR